MTCPYCCVRAVGHPALPWSVCVHNSLGCRRHSCLPMCTHACCVDSETRRHRRERWWAALHWGWGRKGCFPPERAVSHLHCDPVPSHQGSPRLPQVQGLFMVGCCSSLPKALCHPPNLGQGGIVSWGSDFYGWLQHCPLEMVKPRKLHRV